MCSTAEHLLAALRGLGVDNAIIEIDGPEVPIMDGSAAAFVDAIDQAGLTMRALPRRYIEVIKPVRVAKDEAHGELLPYDHGFRIEAEIDFDHPLIGRQALALDIEPETFRREIARARTFGFMKDVSKLWSAGYALGASFDNTLVVTDDRVLNPEGLRFADEFVRHKVLDAIGDLALAGQPLLATYRTVRGGHKLNHAVLSALMADRSAWRVVEAAEPVRRRAPRRCRLCAGLWPGSGLKTFGNQPLPTPYCGPNVGLIAWPRPVFSFKPMAARGLAAGPMQLPPFPGIGCDVAHGCVRMNLPSKLPDLTRSRAR